MESIQKHQQTDQTNQSPSSEKKNFTYNCKSYKESFRWYCENCDLLLTSRVQAQEHIFGKRHQSLVKNKDTYNRHDRLKIAEQKISDKKRLIEFDRLRSPSKSSFDQNLGSGYEISDSDDVIPPPAGRDNILEAVINSEKKTFYSSDFSIYRTPSGKYYCQPCNVSVNSQAQFFQHTESRKHKHKANKAGVKVK